MPGYSGTEAQAAEVGGTDLDSRSSLVSGMLPTPVEALPTDGFLLWVSSDRLEERE